MHFEFEYFIIFRCIFDCGIARRGICIITHKADAMLNLQCDVTTDIKGMGKGEREGDVYVQRETRDFFCLFC
jgi:hypothetical protein